MKYEGSVKLNLFWETENNPWYKQEVSCNSSLEIDDCIDYFKKEGKAKGWIFEGWDLQVSKEEKKMNKVYTEGYGW